VYPENARPTIIFDDAGVCSGCRVFEAKAAIDWAERERLLKALLAEYAARAREAGNPYDCIIPVSGGKDSHYQVHLIKEVYGLNPLLVVFNHVFNTPLGVRNLANLVKRFDCDMIRFTVRPGVVRAIGRYMLRRVGDVTWHYHTGIFTFPFQVAVKYRIPLVIWGEHGYSEVTGMFRLEDIPEFTKWCRQEFEMRGVEIADIVNADSGLTWRDVAPYVFPGDDEMEAVGVRGIYLGNYVRWDALAQARFLVGQRGFRPHGRRRDRTFSLYHKIDDHANDVHDYLKYLKFGYGRATDHASLEIRCGRLTREEGIELVRAYDHARPGTLDLYLEFLGLTEAEFEAAVEPMRDPAIWTRDAAGRWRVTASVTAHGGDAQVEAARLPLVAAEDRTFGANNRGLYYPPDGALVPLDADDRFLDRGGGAGEFVIL
jgi:N-acetyl sugar amidotransferase